MRAPSPKPLLLGSETRARSVLRVRLRGKSARRSDAAHRTAAQVGRLDWTGLEWRGAHERTRVSAPRSAKSKAPAVPPPSKRLDGSGFSRRRLALPHTAMEQKENAVDQDLTLAVVLPGGVEKMTTIQGSQPMMDLLVMLCAKYHLNPSSHTIELVSANRNHIKFKPNALIGSLEAEKILIKLKGTDDKNKKTGPQMPEATVRLIINHKKTQKTILRVNPRVPLEQLMPAVCEKCEFDPKTTVLLRDVHSDQPLDLAKSLNDYGLREVYAKDNKGESPANCPASPLHQEGKSPPGKEKIVKEKENRGFFSIFRRSKKKNDQAVTSSAPASPVLNKRASSSMAPQSRQAPGYCSNTMPSEGSKKRRAPLPPVMASLSFPSDLNRNQSGTQSGAMIEGEQVKPALSRGSSESSLKRTKRKAPLPPGTVSQDEMPPERTVQVGVTPLNTLEEITEPEENICAPALNSSTASGDQDVDVSEDPRLDIEGRSSVLLEEAGKDQPSGLSTDGKPAQDDVSCKEHPRETLDTVGTGLNFEHSDVDSSLSEGKHAQAGGSGEAARTLNVEEQKLGAGVPLKPAALSVMQDSAVQASLGLQVDPVSEEQPESMGTPVGSPVLTSLGVQVSCDRSPPVDCPAPEPSSLNPARLRKDMATSTEEFSSGKAVPVTHQPAVAQALAVASVKESELRPKPSDELTRDYTPKVGLTTYTIMPLKSREKLKFFEVELTLEAPSMNTHHDRSAGSPELAGCPSPNSGPQVSASPSGLHSRSFFQTPPMSNGAVISNGAHCSSTASLHSYGIPQGDGSSSESPSPSGGGVQAYSTLQGNQKKIPPAVKPKPGSFRSPQHKHAPGSYVTSAAEKDMSDNTACGQKDHHGRSPVESPLEVPGDNGFPLPPSPVCFEKAPGEIPLVSRTSGATLPKLTRQWSVPVKEMPAGLGVDKLRCFAAPKPYAAPAPSRFAQAVASAVRRSRSFTRGSSSSSRTSGTGRYSVIELREPSSDMETFSSGTKATELQEAEYPGSARDGNIPGSVLDDVRSHSLYGSAMLCGDPCAVPETLPAPVVNGSSVQAEPLG
uniref:Cordon-bleu WH2 repeat protein like 1 n=1 Tax=Scleropages formosus TaxID=113540 RepID=A0A8C9V393_SCLFO